jgi:hypothetical protein
MCKTVTGQLPLRSLEAVNYKCSAKFVIISSTGDYMTKSVSNQEYRFEYMQTIKISEM